MKLIKSFAMIFAIMALCASAQAVSLTIGSGNYYVSVGDHDYLPYAYGPGYQPGAINFQTAMADYGQWTQMQPFGQVWQPYVAQGWRPYTEGHWVYTQYGPTWVGYEPWAWAGYHYGNWVYSQQIGWAWVPGNTYSPGNVAWAQGYNSLGWMPMPPAGYDYSRGYLAYAGPQNQFTIGNSDFSVGIGVGGGYYQGGPYYDPRYRDMYYNSNYLNTAGNLWTFIDPNYFNSDNYADYYVGGDYAQQMFNQHVVRISSQPLDRVVVERIVRQPIQVRQVETNQITIDGKPTRMVRVQGEDQDVRKNANRVVREVIAPAFAEKGRSFKGPQAKGQAGLNRVLNQGEATPKTETVDSDQLVREARQAREQQEQRRAQVRQKKIDEIQTAVKEGKIRQPNTPPGQLKQEEDTRTRNSQVNPQNPPEQNRPDVERQQDRPDVNRPANTNEDQQNTSRDNRPADRRTNENMNRPDRPTEEQQKNNQNNRDKNHPDQTPPDRRTTPPDHNNMQPDSDQHQNERDDNAVKNGRTTEQPQAESNRENPDKNANAKDQKQSEKDKSKKKKTNRDKDKNENPDQPPPER